MKSHIIRITIPFKPPQQQHNKYVNGSLVYTNQTGDDRRITLPVRYVVRSDYWWPAQQVTDKNGNIWETDVFEYGDLYVILMSDSSKIQVVNDGDIRWHII